LMSSRSSTWRSTQERCGCNPSTSSFPSPTLQDFPASVTNHVREHNETFKATNKIQLTNMKEHMTVQNHQPQNALELVVPLRTIIHGMRSLVAELEGNPWSGGTRPLPPTCAYLRHCASPLSSSSGVLVGSIARRMRNLRSASNLCLCTCKT
jgi:hypothetical protein